MWDVHQHTWQRRFRYYPHVGSIGHRSSPSPRLEVQSGEPPQFPPLRSLSAGGVAAQCGADGGGGAGTAAQRSSRRRSGGGGGGWCRSTWPACPSTRATPWPRRCGRTSPPSASSPFERHSSAAPNRWVVCVGHTAKGVCCQACWCGAAQQESGLTASNHCWPAAITKTMRWPSLLVNSDNVQTFAVTNGPPNESILH